jgi:hypothetical protein
MKNSGEKKSGSSKSVDMSPEAIDRRLRIVSELRNLCMQLEKAKVIKPIKNEPNILKSEI